MTVYQNRPGVRRAGLAVVVLAIVAYGYLADASYTPNGGLGALLPDAGAPGCVASSDGGTWECSVIDAGAYPGPDGGLAVAAGGLLSVSPVFALSSDGRTLRGATDAGNTDLQGIDLVEEGPYPGYYGYWLHNGEGDNGRMELDGVGDMFVTVINGSGTTRGIVFNVNGQQQFQMFSDHILVNNVSLLVGTKNRQVGTLTAGTVTLTGFYAGCVPLCGYKTAKTGETLPVNSCTQSSGSVTAGNGDTLDSTSTVVVDCE